MATVTGKTYRGRRKSANDIERQMIRLSSMARSRGAVRFADGTYAGISTQAGNRIRRIEGIARRYTGNIEEQKSYQRGSDRADRMIAADVKTGLGEWRKLRERKFSRAARMGKAAGGAG